MKVAARVLLALSLMSLPAWASSESMQAAEAEAHLRKACEIVWAKAKPYQIERCTRRAMAALGNDDQLRDNELKRLLVDSERELQRCKDELALSEDEKTPSKNARNEELSPP